MKVDKDGIVTYTDMLGHWRQITDADYERHNFTNGSWHHAQCPCRTSEDW